MTTIQVIATTFEGARNALAVAIPLARSRRAHLNVAVVNVIPAHAALEVSSAEGEAVRRRCAHLLEDLGGEGDIAVLRCHSWSEVLDRTPAGVTTIVGGPLGQPTAAQRRGGACRSVDRTGKARRVRSVLA